MTTALGKLGRGGVGQFHQLHARYMPVLHQSSGVPVHLQMHPHLTQNHTVDSFPTCWSTAHQKPPGQHHSIHATSQDTTGSCHHNRKCGSTQDYVIKRNNMAVSEVVHSKNDNHMDLHI